MRITGEFERTWKILREENVDHETLIVEDQGDTELWQVYRRIGQIPANIKELHDGGRRDFETAVAVPQVGKEIANQSICVFFPTHETLPCGLVIHATLETTDDRNHFVDHPSNREVLRQLANHVADVVERQSKEIDPRRGLQLLAGVESGSTPVGTNSGFCRCAHSRVR